MATPEGWKGLFSFGPAARPKRWPLLPATLIAVTLLYLSTRHVEWPRVWHAIRGARLPYAAAAIALTMFSFFVRALRWRILLNAEARFPVATVFWANAAGYLGNSFLPARAGEVIRSCLISSRSKLSTAYVLTTALGERMMDALALVLCSSLVLLLGVTPEPHWMEDLSRTMAVFAGAGALAIMVLPHTDGLLENVAWHVPLPLRFRGLLLRWAAQVLQGLRAFHDWRRFAAFASLTAVVWLIDSLGVMAGARAVGIVLSLRVAVLLLSALGLGSALPSTPGYVGIFQFVAVTVLMPFSVPRDAALAYILLSQALGYAVVLLYGLPALYMLRRRV